MGRWTDGWKDKGIKGESGDREKEAWMERKEGWRDKGRIES